MSTTLDLGALSIELSAHTITPTNPIQVSQIHHRLQILQTGFDSYDGARAALHGRRIMEIGCGQGDMTAVLAHMQMPSPANTTSSPQLGKVLAIDPAPLDYGTPYTLGDAQHALTTSVLGPHIQWIQQDPLEFPTASPGQAAEVDLIVLAHSPFYLPSEAYFAQLLRALRDSRPKDSSTPRKTRKLLLAEWGMRASAPAAEAHLLAVQAQRLAPLPMGNVRTVLEPERMLALARAASWQLESEKWIVEPRIDDGQWEVDAARGMFASAGAKTQTEEVRKQLEDLEVRMEEAVKRFDDKVACMDVWVGLFSANA